MTKNIEDLLYRGDSLERMGEMSGRLREDSRKYKKAAVRINWELLLEQVSRSSFNPAGIGDCEANLGNPVRTSCRSRVFHLYTLDLVAFLLV